MLERTFGINYASPSTAENDNLIFKLGKTSALVVAIGLFLFALILLSNILTINAIMPKYLKYAFVCIFLIRTIGDFKHVDILKP